jgi:hypothetical protein
MLNFLLLAIAFLSGVVNISLRVIILLLSVTLVKPFFAAFFAAIVAET